MLFNSLQYAVFLPVVLAGYFLLPHRLRTLWLLAASCVFYMVYKPVYIIVLAALIAIDYFAALAIQGAPRRRARIYLVISVASTCLVLIVFKYYHFLTDNLSALAAHLGYHLAAPDLQLLLPIGLSFHTFQSLAYVIEVYRGNQKAERNPLIYATYVMFFPQLVAGPIERPSHLLPQFREIHRFNAAEAPAALQRIALGLFKKAVIADRLNPIVGDIFGAPQKFSGFYLALGAVAFAYQVYCDFSGYTDIAIGSARLLGFRLMENFQSPFASRSIGEFWRRWHISLSTWFRDYVFIPMGGSRVPAWKTTRNLMITFTLSGLWHGAGWTYILWGAGNGAWMAAGRAIQPWREALIRRIGLQRHPLRAPAGVLLTFSFFCVSLIYFRSPDMTTANYIFTHLWRGWHIYLPIETSVGQVQFEIALGAILLLEIWQWAHRRRHNAAELSPAVPFHWAYYAAFICAIGLFGVFLDAGTFIYFQF